MGSLNGVSANVSRTPLRNFVVHAPLRSTISILCISYKLRVLKASTMVIHTLHPCRARYNNPSTIAQSVTWVPTSALHIPSMPLLLRLSTSLPLIHLVSMYLVGQRALFIIYPRRFPRFRWALCTMGGRFLNLGCRVRLAKLRSMVGGPMR